MGNKHTSDGGEPRASKQVQHSKWNNDSIQEDLLLPLILMTMVGMMEELIRKWSPSIELP